MKHALLLLSFITCILNAQDISVTGIRQLNQAEIRGIYYFRSFS